MFGGSTLRRKHKCYTLRGNYSCNIEVLDQLVICGTVPRMKKGISLNKLKDIGIQQQWEMLLLK